MAGVGIKKRVDAKNDGPIEALESRPEVVCSKKYHVAFENFQTSV